MKITIAGAGAMGSRFGLMLHQAGHEVLLVDGWKDHVDAIQKEGLKANYNGEEIVVKLPAVLQSEVTEEMTSDLIILFTKAMQLESMLTDLKPVIHDETRVLCLLNGIGHEEVIEAKANAEEIVEVLNSGGLNASYSENILFAIYKKACVNGTMNGLCTILMSNMYEFGSTTTAHLIVENIVKEFSEVAKNENILLNVSEIVDFIETNCYNRETIGLHHPSMYQDLNENNRLTEIDYINGAVVRKGQKYGVPTPYCEFLTALVHCKEQILGAK